MYIEESLKRELWYAKRDMEWLKRLWGIVADCEKKSGTCGAQFSDIKRNKANKWELLWTLWITWKTWVKNG